ncbi:hypothetical protein JOE21_002721 [Desmospora profundinema]|uniref:NADH dehydrogenase subunit 4 n=1 Tax=Desmospora profundinema TaxID=1571184 RepID=A0ABU1IPI8_9BACL|nr:hypothetical protein [Desmospora profundinema]
MFFLFPFLGKFKKLVFIQVLIILFFTLLSLGPLLLIF